MCGAKPRCEIVEFRNKIQSRKARKGVGPHSGGDGSLPGMLIKKPATRIKVLLVAFRQGHLLGPCEVSRVSDHFVGRRFRANSSFGMSARGRCSGFRRGQLSRLRSAT